MRYFRRHWNESRGDDYDSWGEATYYFEVDDAYWVVRQIEVYQSGAVLKYDQGLAQDRYGGLSEKALDAEDFAPFEISACEFEGVWAGTAATSRR